MVWRQLFTLIDNAPPVLALQLDSLERLLPPNDKLGLTFHVLIDWVHNAYINGLITDIESDIILHSLREREAQKQVA